MSTYTEEQIREIYAAGGHLPLDVVLALRAEVERLKRTVTDVNAEVERQQKRAEKVEREAATVAERQRDACIDFAHANIGAGEAFELRSVPLVTSEPAPVEPKPLRDAHEMAKRVREFVEPSRPEPSISVTREQAGIIIEGVMQRIDFDLVDAEFGETWNDFWAKWKAVAP